MTRDQERVERAMQDPIVGGLPGRPRDRRGDAAQARARRPPARAGRRAARPRLPGLDAPARPARDDRDGGVRRERLLLLHGLARGVRDGAPGARRRRRARAAGRRRQDGLVGRPRRRRCARCSTSPGRLPRRRAALSEADVQAALDAGATDADVQLAVADLVGRSRCTTGSSTASVRGPRRAPRPTASAGGRDRRARLQRCPAPAAAAAR